MSLWEEPPRTHWREHMSSLDWEQLNVPQEELDSDAKEREVWESPLDLSL